LKLRPQGKESPMYLVAIGWLYVALMMALAELMHPAGGALGALVTFVLYGLAPVGLVVYLMATPMRRRARAEAERLADRAAATPTPTSGGQPDAGGHAPGAPAVASVREEV
jgi:hypothetical protein